MEQNSKWRAIGFKIFEYELLIILKNITMRKKFTILLLAFIALIVTVQSCKKDKVTPQKEESNEVLKMKRSAEMGKTEANIVEFFKRMNIVRENPNNEEAKRWNYTKEKVIWYIEAALNYKYAYKWQYMGKEERSDLYNIDSSFTNIAVNTSGEDYNIVQLQTSYAKLAKDLEEQYKKTESDSKFFVLSDIILKSGNNNSLKIMQYSVIGKAGEVVPQSGWKWGNGLGDCAGNNVGMDATDVIENKLSLTRHTINSPTGYWGFVNVGSLQNGNNGTIYPFSFPIPTGVNNPTPFANYLLFYTDVAPNDPAPCISNSNLDWYTNNILAIEANNEPYNKRIVYTSVYGVVGGSVPVYSLIHEIKPYYGELVFYKYIIPID